jgi:hypothetical protein
MAKFNMAKNSPLLLEAVELHSELKKLTALIKRAIDDAAEDADINKLIRKIAYVTMKLADITAWFTEDDGHDSGRDSDIDKNCLI